ncbi:MAG: dihydrofolate reductase family protein, partial [Methanothrix sp.]|nr:dihydrofolate reductase family protein [Methanothrix sp.]
RHIDCIIAGEDHVDLRAALQEMNSRYGVLVVRVDAGGTLNGLLLRKGLVAEVSLLIYPSLVGGEKQSGIFVAPDLAAAADQPESQKKVISLKLMKVEQLKGDVVWLRYEVLSTADQ